MFSEVLNAAVAGGTLVAVYLGSLAFVYAEAKRAAVKQIRDEHGTELSDIKSRLRTVEHQNDWVNDNE